MLIYSLDRKTILKASTLAVTKNYGGKKEAKWAITAESKSGLQAVTAAVFAEEKTAIDALEKAFEAFANGASAYKFD